MSEVMTIDGRFGEGSDLDFDFKPCRKTALAEAVQMDQPFEVRTPEGTMRGEAGDYLMRGVNGELYPCDEETFYQTYTFDGPDVSKEELLTTAERILQDVSEHIEEEPKDVEKLLRRTRQRLTYALQN